MKPCYSLTQHLRHSMLQWHLNTPAFDSNTERTEHYKAKEITATTRTLERTRIACVL
jgi:hypothetical protein